MPRLPACPHTREVTPTPESVKPLRVVVIDADPRVRTSLVGLLGLGDGVEIVGSAGHPGLALEVCQAADPDVVVVDPRLPDVDGGLALIGLIRLTLPGVCVLVMSWSDGLENQALACGADGFIAKSAAPVEIVERITILAGGRAPN
jgi:two-component system NarL family response regulator/two-component system response regulator DevR